MIAGPAGIAAASARTISIIGCALSAAVMKPEKSARSTASAEPAGTRARSARRGHDRYEPPHLFLEHADRRLDAALRSELSTPAPQSSRSDAPRSF